MRRSILFFYTAAGILFGLLFPLSFMLWLLIDGGYSLTLRNMLLVQNNNRFIWVIDTAPLFLGLFAWYAALRKAKLLELNNELAWQKSDKERLTTELEHLRGKFEVQHAGHLEKLGLAVGIAREAFDIRDLDTLLEESVNLITARFGYYHTRIFLLDNQNEFVVLYAASSKTGVFTSDDQPKLPVNKAGIIGRTVETGEPSICPDVCVDATYIANPDLPHTRSAAAIPLSSRSVMIGVLEVQSTQPNAFSDEDIAILRSLTDQIALAIENARLAEGMQRSLKELAAINRRYVCQAWQPGKSPPNLVFTFDQIKGTMRNVASNLQEVDTSTRSLASTIMLHGQALGTISFQRDDGEPDWTEEEIDFFHAITAQLGLALENARLVEEAQAQARREKLVDNISTKLWSSSDFETVVQTAIEELCSALNLKQAVIELDALTYQRLSLG